MWKITLFCVIFVAFASPGINAKEKEPIDHTLEEWEKYAEPRKYSESSREDWIRSGQEALQAALERQQLNQNVAKNVIIFIGDGMGTSTIAAARILDGQEKFPPDEDGSGGSGSGSGDDTLISYGEENYLSFEKFPFVSLVKVYNTDWQVPDSAGTATAILTGVKTLFNVVGVDDGAEHGVCESQEGTELDSIMYWAQDEGKATGFVSNMALTHATPACAYASSVTRGWECDADQLPGQRMCPDIAKQFVERGHMFDVALGGGRTKFFPEEMEDPAQPGSYGDRLDGRNLIGEWEQDKIDKDKVPAVVYTTEEMEAVDIEATDYIFGLFARGSMSYHREKSPSQPSVSEMTGKAIEILQKNDDGFVLMVEGGRIDIGHHASRAKRALTETIEFATAVEVAVNMTDEDDTLIIVTADHGHAFSFGGYSYKGQPILGKAIYPANDGLPYTRLTYGNGPGFDPSHPPGREDLRDVDVQDNEYVYQSPLPLGSDTHSGEDVSVYARGPMAHLLQGVQEQSYIAHVAGYAACIGMNKEHCELKKNQVSPRFNFMGKYWTGDAAHITGSAIAVLMSALLSLIIRF